MSEEWANIVRAYTDIRFAHIVREEAKRTIVCHPDQVAAFESAITTAGLEETVTVTANPWLPFDGDAYILDIATVEAGHAEALQHSVGVVRNCLTDESRNLANGITAMRGFQRSIDRLWRDPGTAAAEIERARRGILGLADPRTGEPGEPR